MGYLADAIIEDARTGVHSRATRFAAARAAMLRRQSGAALPIPDSRSFHHDGSTHHAFPFQVTNRIRVQLGHRARILTATDLAHVD